MTEQQQQQSQTNSPNTSSHLLASLTDPVSTFQHTIEAQRQAALAHEQLLIFQLATLEADLLGIRKMIAGCDAALVSLNTPAAPPTTSQTTTVPATTYPSTLESETSPVTSPVDETPIPPFLTSGRPEV